MLIRSIYVADETSGDSSLSALFPDLVCELTLLLFAESIDCNRKSDVVQDVRHLVLGIDPGPGSAGHVDIDCLIEGWISQ